MPTGDPQKEALKSVNYADMPIMPDYFREEEERRRRMYPPLGSETERYLRQIEEKVHSISCRIDNMEKQAFIERDIRGKAERTMVEMTKALKESNEALAAYRKAFEE